MSKLKIFFIFLLISLVIHFYKFPKLVSFDADQEYYAQKYREIILMRKPTLIGIPTSIGGMFVGPLYTYFSTFVYFASYGNPLGIYIVTLVISSLNAPLTYLLFTKIKNRFVGVVGGIFALFSFTLFAKAFAPSIIQLLYPAGLFFFYLICVSIYKKRYSYLLILLFFLTFQIHFSLFLFFPIFFVIAFWQKKKIKLTKKFLVITLLAIFVSLLPLIIFDLRHANLLSKNIADFIASNNTDDILNLKHLRKFVLSFWDFSSHLFFPQINIFTTIFLLFISVIFLMNLKKNKNLFIAAIFLAVPFVLLFFYRGTIPDYYLLFLSPVIFYIVSDSLSLLRWPALFFLLILIFLNIKAQGEVVNPYNFFIKLKAVRYLRSKSQDQAVRVLLDTDLGLGFGFDYLMDYVGVIRTNDLNAKTFQISLRRDKSVALAEFKEEGLPLGVKIKAL